MTKDNWNNNFFFGYYNDDDDVDYFISDENAIYNSVLFIIKLKVIVVEWKRKDFCSDESSIAANMMVDNDDDDDDENFNYLFVSEIERETRNRKDF